MMSHIIQYNQYVVTIGRLPSGLLRQARMCLQLLTPLLTVAGLLLPASAAAAEREWSMGVYAGRYYNTEPAAFYQGRTEYLDHYIVAVTASKTLWHAESWPFAIELDGMMGHQFGLATLQEVAVAPVARWYGFPWNHYLQTDVRFGPVGVSYTSIVSPIERGPSGDGSHFLNFLLLELGFSLPEEKEHEMFIRLHHRCSGYDTINNFGANGEDFFALGYRQYY
ncbi:MAG: hypothetical protein WC236_12795 [Gallionellaceae bacterium]|jgi:hypothetical protein